MDPDRALVFLCYLNKSFILLEEGSILKNAVVRQ